MRALWPTTNLVIHCRENTTVALEPGDDEFTEIQLVDEGRRTRTACRCILKIQATSTSIEMFTATFDEQLCRWKPPPIPDEDCVFTNVKLFSKIKLKRWVKSFLCKVCLDSLSEFARHA